MNKNVYLALGSNIGDRLDNLKKACEAIAQLEATNLLKTSKIYETDPVGYEDQAKFLNMAVEIETIIEPLDLLKKLQEIELSLKRKREIRWGPRTIDIDILLFDNIKMDSTLLTIPHKSMKERAFVLMPLRDIADNALINKLEIEKLLKNCSDLDGIRLFGGAI